MPTNKKFDDELSVRDDNEDIKLDLDVEQECMEDSELKLI